MREKKKLSEQKLESWKQHELLADNDPSTIKQLEVLKECAEKLGQRIYFA